jgi:hypothetical protein
LGRAPDGLTRQIKKVSTDQLIFRIYTFFHTENDERGSTGGFFSNVAVVVGYATVGSVSRRADFPEDFFSGGNEVE